MIKSPTSDIMASALRKLFRSSDRLRDDARSNSKNSSSDSPSRHSNSRRFFSHSESPRMSRRDSKISPLETGAGVPPAKGTNHGLSFSVFKSKSSKNNNDTSGTKSGSGSSGTRLSESVAKHNQEVRSRRLMKEFQEISKSSRSHEKPPFTVELVDDNLYEWNIRLYEIDPESDFYRDMQETGTTHILLNLNFPDNFPFSPPFMRVITPQVEKGFVMEGGAICMELLTPRGWASAYTVEAVIMQFAASLVKGQGRMVRKSKNGKEFNKKMAEASFRSLVKTHEKYGWVTPPLADG